PAVTYYLSEGATGAFFDEDVLIANPNASDAPVTLTFSKEDGSQVTTIQTVPAQAHATVHVDRIPGMEATAASTQVRSEFGLPLVVDRTRFWDRTYYAGACDVHVPARSRLAGDEDRDGRRFDAIDAGLRHGAGHRQPVVWHHRACDAADHGGAL